MLIDHLKTESTSANRKNAILRTFTSSTETTNTSFIFSKSYIQVYCKYAFNIFELNFLSYIIYNILWTNYSYNEDKIDNCIFH